MGKKKVGILINFPEDTLDRITAYAEALGMNRSQFIRDCVEETMMAGVAPGQRRLVDEEQKERLRGIVKGFVSDLVMREVLADLVESDQETGAKKRKKRGKK